MLADLLARRRIIVSAGPGGVGKTTVAASLGALAARSGRRTLVATIDPAPRLADALGLPGLGPTATPVPADVGNALGVPAGALFAARIDTALAFRNLVEGEAKDPEMRRRIFDNAIYRQMTSTLTGSQEYAATVALHDFFHSGAFDLVVLDTPPTANALDFLDAPRRIAEAVQSPAISWFARDPGESTSRFSLKRLRSGGAMILQRVGKFVGSTFLDDLGAFLGDFQHVLGGFLRRAQAVEALLRRPDAGFLLVLAPELPAVNEALTFFERLNTAGLRLDGFVANRVLAPPGLDAGAISERLGQQPDFARWTADERASTTQALSVSIDFLTRAARAQQRELDRLRGRAPHVPLHSLPLLSHEASSLAALRALGDRLGGTPPAFP
ncbi:MAG TPA: ArsA-related P-loop ATPase [Polyangia bacterium]